MTRFGTRWIDININEGDETKLFYCIRLVVEEYKRQGDWSFFTATPPLEALRAWTEPVVLMLIDVRRAHLYNAARRKVFVELPAEAGADKSKVGHLLRSMYNCRDAGVHWEFAICEVTIAVGFVQGRASPCIYRHLEWQLRVWVHGDDFVPLGYIVNVRWFFVKLQEFWVVRIEGFLDLLDTTTAYKAPECLADSWNGLLKASPGRQTLDML